MHPHRSDPTHPAHTASVLDEARDNRPNGAGSVAAGVHHIGEAIDFKPYLEAVAASSQRSRSVIYIVFLLMIATICPLRNTVLTGAMDARLKRLTQAAACWEAGQNSRPCSEAEAYAAHLEVALGPIGAKVAPADDMQHEAYKRQIEAIIQKRTDQHLVQIPIVGLSVDINDLWLISGLPLMLVLYVLGASLFRERDNLKRAVNVAVNVTRSPQNLELLAMAQVLSSSHSESSNAIRKVIMPLTFALPVIVHGIVVAVDIHSLPMDRLIGSYLRGISYYEYMLVAQLLVWLFVGGLSWGAYRQWQANDTEMKKLFDGIPSIEHDIWASVAVIEHVPAELVAHIHATGTH